MTLNGPRQAGKSTLMLGVMKARGGELRNLDEGSILAAARADPNRFVRHTGLLGIDEIQRAPELVLAIKEAVDRETRPGQFLLTGSARVLGLRRLPDALVGRMETLELWPFSQGELARRREDFVSAIFENEPSFPSGNAETRDGYIERLTTGGFPEAVRRDEGRRARFFAAYAGDLVDRDVAQLAELQRKDSLHLLLRAAASHAASHLKVESFASSVGIPASTVERYLALFEEVFLLKRLPAWSASTTGRSVHMRKLLFVDTGLCAHLCGRSVKRLLKDDAAVGPLLENFVISELARQLGWSSTQARLSHFRTRDGVEVDAVLEHGDGRVVGIEVKSAESVREDDFRGLRYLAARLKTRFHHGVVLYAGSRSLPFGEQFSAAPIDVLWRL